MAENVEQILKRITEKTKKLKDRNTRLEKENLESRETIFNLLCSVSDLKKEIANANTINNATQVAKQNNLNNQELKKNIDKYLKVIDKAIAKIQVEK